MILSCHHISKAFGENEILKDASFGLEDHEKAAIIGINGAGKSTLLKIIVGQLSADSGEVIVAKDRSIGYLAQQDMLSGQTTIRGELQEVRRDLYEAEGKIRQLEHDMKGLEGQELEDTMHQYHRLTTYFEQNGGYSLESEITGILRGLGFDTEDFDKPTQKLSGGQKTRVALGKLLLSSPDILILDEPTNHLDIRSIDWLENYLKTYKGAVLIVSHDRYFLNRIVSKVVEIDHGQVTTFAGDYDSYSEKKKQLRDTQLKAWIKQQAEIRHQEEVIEKLRSFNREKSIRRAESREKVLEKTVRLEKPMDEDAQINLTLEPDIVSGQDVLQVAGLSKRFGSQQLFKDLSFDVRRGERVALIGANGTGKTTLLKIINGLLEADNGEIRLGSKVHIGYYDQDHQVLHPEKTLFEEISDAYPDLNNTRIRSVLAAFLFTGDDVFKRICEISGGERGRVSLAKLMLSSANFLILDEPTNHLDVYSKEILESALANYTGTVLYVSHDRYFVNKTCTRILDLTENTLVEYQGDYDYYLEKKDELMNRLVGEGLIQPVKASVPTAASAPAASSKLSWQQEKDEQARLRRLKNEFKKTEDAIARLEEEDEGIDEQLADETVFTNQKKCMELTIRKDEIRQELEALYERWEELAEEIG